MHSLSMLLVWKGSETSHYLGEERQIFVHHFKGFYLFIYLFIRLFSMGTTTYRYSGYTFMKTILVHAEGPLATCASGLSMLQKLIT